MNNFLPYVFTFSLLFSQFYTFSDNIRLTESLNDQKFPEVAIDSNYIHLSWVSVVGNNKNIMYSRSDDSGESFSIPIQLNFTDNNIIAYGQQSGPRLAIYEIKVYITYTDDRTGFTSVYLSVSEDYGNVWQEEVLISDTPYLNAYQDFEVDGNGNLHLIYFNYAANYELEDVRYRYASGNDTDFLDSSPMGIVSNEQEPCDCCQPDLDIDSNGNLYVAYRNNILNNRDTFLAVKRYNQDEFSEFYQVSDFDDYITFCPSSGPTIDIKDSNIAVAYTVYYTHDGYVDVSSLNQLNFSSSINLNTESNGFPNYPYVLIDENIHILWADQGSGNWDIYYGMRDSETGAMENIQKINDDDTNHNQKDQIARMFDENLFLFWADQRNGNYEIYLSVGQDVSITPGDVNQDLTIDILDIVLVVNFILGQQIPNNFQQIASDINGDSIINIQDIILLLNIILN